MSRTYKAPIALFLLAAAAQTPAPGVRQPVPNKHYTGQIRNYYIAAEPLDWNYAPKGRDQLPQLGLPMPWQNSQQYKKYHYVQYTDDTFTRPVPQPAWLGILGPVIRGVVGDTLKVTFLNRADSENRIFSIHPHGVRYDKDSEGSYNLNPKPGRGSWITRSKKFTYTWNVDAEAGPAPGEPSSKIWLYHSHVSSGDDDINLGLVGAIIVTDAAHARPDGTPSDVDREFVTLFLIFNENGEMEGMDGDTDDIPADVREKKMAFHKMMPDQQKEMLEGGLKHTINGYMFGNLPGLEMNEGEHVRWYLAGLGSEQDVHVAHWHGKTILEDGHRRTDDVELLPGSMKVADMKADNPGTWMFHCHVSDHMMGGMYAYYTIHPARGTEVRAR